jgi:GNAT superfamily N-acetyltransferase
MKIKIVKARKEHKDYLLRANAEINQVNEVKHESNFSQNLERDLFTSKPKFKCLVAVADNKPVGMVLYSNMYWADDGEVLWISQTHVDKEYRKYGVFLKLIQELKNRNKDAVLISCATGKTNKTMQKLLKFAGGKKIDLLFYYLPLKK